MTIWSAVNYGLQLVLSAHPKSCEPIEGWAIWQKYHITILCHVGFIILSEHYSQNNSLL